MIEKVKRRKRPPIRTIIVKDQLPHNLWGLLKVAGYNYRPVPHDWIRQDKKEGRFHIKKIGSGEFQLHYDIYGETCDHYSIPMPWKCARERQRLWAIAKNLSRKAVSTP